MAEFNKLSVRELKALLASVGVRHDHCLAKAELLELVTSYPHPFPRAASAASPSPADAAASLAALDGPALFAALRRAGEGTTAAARRDVTSRVRAHKLLAWRAAPSFQGMARHLVDDVHPIFREGFGDVLAASRARGAVDAAAFRRVNGSLHHHHENEDAMWFPRLRARHPELAGEVDVLEADHAALVRLEPTIAGGGAGALAALEEFVAALEDHLNREEMLTLPALMDGTGGL